MAVLADTNMLLGAKGASGQTAFENALLNINKMDTIDQNRQLAQQRAAQEQRALEKHPLASALLMMQARNQAAQAGIREYSMTPAQQQLNNDAIIAQTASRNALADQREAQTVHIGQKAYNLTIKGNYLDALQELEVKGKKAKIALDKARTDGLITDKEYTEARTNLANINTSLKKDEFDNRGTEHLKNQLANTSTQLDNIHKLAKITKTEAETRFIDAGTNFKATRSTPEFVQAIINNKNAGTTKQNAQAELQKLKVIKEKVDQEVNTPENLKKLKELEIKEKELRNQILVSDQAEAAFKSTPEYLNAQESRSEGKAQLVDAKIAQLNRKEADASTKKLLKKSALAARSLQSPILDKDIAGVKEALARSPDIEPADKEYLLSLAEAGDWDRAGLIISELMEKGLAVGAIQETDLQQKLRYSAVGGATGKLARHKETIAETKIKHDSEQFVQTHLLKEKKHLLDITEEDRKVAELQEKKDQNERLNGYKELRLEQQANQYKLNVLASDRAEKELELKKELEPFKVQKLKKDMAALDVTIREKKQKISFAKNAQVAKGKQALLNANETLDVLNEILTWSPTKINSIIGKNWYKASLPGTVESELGGLIKKVQSRAFLNKIELFRGFGHLSDAEGAKIMQAALALDMEKIEHVSYFIKEISALRSSVATSVGIIKDQFLLDDSGAPKAVLTPEQLKMIGFTVK